MHLAFDSSIAGTYCWVNGNEPKRLLPSWDNLQKRVDPMCPDNSPKGDRWEDIVWRKTQYNDRTVLKSGSYLNSFCPHCGASLIKDHQIHLDTVNQEGEEGWVEISPYLNVFDRSSDIHLTEGQEVADLRCPDCHKSLRVEGRTCEKGDSHVACNMIGISSISVPLYFCMRVGCRWHKIAPADEHKIILDDSNEW